MILAYNIYMKYHNIFATYTQQYKLRTAISTNDCRGKLIATY